MMTPSETIAREAAERQGYVRCTNVHCTYPAGRCIENELYDAVIEVAVAACLAAVAQFAAELEQIVDSTGAVITEDIDATLARWRGQP